jgi:hypothetical protein
MESESCRPYPACSQVTAAGRGCWLLHDELRTVEGSSSLTQIASQSPRAISARQLSYSNSKARPFGALGGISTISNRQAARCERHTDLSWKKKVSNTLFLAW